MGLDVTGSGGDPVAACVDDNGSLSPDEVIGNRSVEHDNVRLPSDGVLEEGPGDPLDWNSDIEPDTDSDSEVDPSPVDHPDPTEPRRSTRRRVQTQHFIHEGRLGDQFGLASRASQRVDSSTE